ncbi:MAG TPA: hypothetical protein VGO41_01980 [Steroidobacteraceae bacterium]|jgi:hypothetical protein|nr:hypothetical protein [Steroidobacteraceae bacterium]
MPVVFKSPSEMPHQGGLEDPTVDLDELRRPNYVSAQLARAAEDHIESLRISHRVRASMSLVGAAIIVMAISWYGTSENPTSQPSQAPGVALPHFAPTGVAVASGVPTPAVAVHEPASANMQTDPQPVTAQRNVAAPLAVFGSAARRDCMAQVESAVLFQLMARDAKNRGTYNVAVNREIKRLLGRHAVREPRTLDLIAAQVWAERSRLSASPAWWTAQYRRCEERGLQGAQYLVSAD